MSRILANKANLITNPYKKGVHDGIDVVGERRTTDYVIAHKEGTVIEVRSDYKTTDSKGNSYGNYVKIQHDNYVTLYAHLKYGSVTVKPGDVVHRGQVIGFMGATGFVTAAHLHFEVRTGSAPSTRIDPTNYINADYNVSSNNDIVYRVYDNVKRCWLSEIHSAFGTGIMSYAGNYGNAISALQIVNKRYRVHDRIKNEWLSWVTSNTGVGIDAYAGNIGNPIDGVQIEGCEYRAHLKNGGWLAWVDKVDETAMGYAGIYGRDIDAVQIRACS